MNIKKNTLISIAILIISILSILNIKNTNKISIHLLTTKTAESSLGNFLTFTFISGFIFGSTLSTLVKYEINPLIKNRAVEDKEKKDYIDNEDKDQILEIKRPPERDIRDSQPTISVNYRFVDQKNDYSKRQIIKNNEADDNFENNDWFETNQDW